MKTINKPASVLLSMILFLSILLIPNINTLAAVTIQNTNIIEATMYVDYIYYNNIDKTYDAIILDIDENGDAEAYEIELINAEKENINMTKQLNDILKDKKVFVKLDTKGTISDLRDDIILEYNFVN